MKILLEIPDEIAEAIIRDALYRGESVQRFILDGLAAGISDGYEGKNCEYLLYDYLSETRP